MVPMNPVGQGGGLPRSELQAEPKLLHLLYLALPTVNRGDRPFDLHAGRQAETDDVGGHLVRIGTARDRGPGDMHVARVMDGKRGRQAGKLALDAPWAGSTANRSFFAHHER